MRASIKPTSSEAKEASDIAPFLELRTRAKSVSTAGT